MEALTLNVNQNQDAVSMKTIYYSSSGISERPSYEALQVQYQSRFGLSIEHVRAQRLCSKLLIGERFTRKPYIQVTYWYWAT